MFGLVCLRDFNSDFERSLFVIEKVSNLLLKALFLEAKSEPIIVGKFLEEFLFVGEAERVSSVGTHKAVVRPRDRIG
jgi:hypothetical protein